MQKKKFSNLKSNIIIVLVAAAFILVFVLKS